MVLLPVAGFPAAGDHIVVGVAGQLIAGLHNEGADFGGAAFRRRMLFRLALDDPGKFPVQKALDLASFVLLPVHGFEVAVTFILLGSPFRMNDEE
ncbi:hypothetical protein D3C75_764550 [compost metagenome]